MDTNAFLAGLNAIFASGKNEEVSAYLKKSLVQAEAEDDKQAVITVLNEMIGYYRITNKYAELIPASERAIELMRSLGEAATLNFATTLFNSAAAYKALGDNEKAFELYNAALEIYICELPEGNPRLAAIYSNLSAIYQESGNFESAREYLSRAALILARIKGSEIDAAIVYTNLALVLFELKQEDEATATLQKALSLFESTAENGPAPSTAPRYANALNGLAGAYFKMKDYKKSAELYEAALIRIKNCYGKNSDYVVSCRNCAAAYEAAGLPAKARELRLKAETALKAIGASVRTGSLKGLELARSYYKSHGKEMISRRFADYAERIAVGLVGEGSECFGFDDDISQDHNFGPAFCLWLTRADYEKIGSKLQQAYDELPKSFMGYAARAHSPHAERRTGVLCIEDFYCKYIHSPDARLSLTDWLRIPESALATVTNGEVFNDPLGEFSKIRSGLLAYYPEDVRLKKIAACAAAMAQAGQANYAVCMSRGESVAAFSALAEFIKHASRMVFLLNRKYAPFYKWTHRAMRNLPILPEAFELMGKLSLAGLDKTKWCFATPREMIGASNTRDENAVIIKRFCQLVAAQLKKEGLSDADDDFLLSHAQSVLSRVKDPALRALHIMEG